MIQAVKPLSDDVGKKAACEALEVSRATFYRHLNPAKPQTPRPQPPLALSPAERQRDLETYFYLYVIMDVFSCKWERCFLSEEKLPETLYYTKIKYHRRGAMRVEFDKNGGKKLPF
ncbi:MAG: hypothetical protein U5R30_19695 [Deltaproteobacteria bacterium]|nr:hypothetical protein [Deltaproteobacteria bacterium]